jgi:hypothetical protein
MRPAAQPGQPLRIVAVHPVPERLPVHAAGPRGLAAALALKHQRQGQHAPRRSGVLVPRRLTPQVRRAVLIPRDRTAAAMGRVLPPPAPSTESQLSHPAKSLKMPRVTQSGRWYKIGHRAKSDVRVGLLRA